MGREATALGLPVSPEGAAGVAAILDDPAGALLATDFDGTLAPIVDDPADARPAAGAVETLAALAAHVGRVVVVTGRPAQLAVDLGGIRAVPGAVVLGLYGAERWQDGTLTPAAPPNGLSQARREVEVVIDAFPGVSIEDKGATFAVHTRTSAEPSASFAALRPRIEAIAAACGLRVAPGRFALEVHGLDHDKGEALESIATQTAARAVVYCGDDVGDLAAFATVRRLRTRGIAGLTVAARSDEVPAAAADADLVVDGPSGVVDFLQRLLAAL
ncbi:MAG: trehalose-phosphatase [Candidatus Nanopelagicales bacterium]